MSEPENLVLHMLRRLDEKMDRMGESLRSEIAEVRAEVRSEIRSLRADVASDMLDLEKRLGDQITGLRRSVMEYHSTVIGHGVLYGELEQRVGRIERHLNLEPVEKH